MATGPHSTNYQIPQITLGDTFNEWRNISNDSIINKLNRMKVYTGKSGDGISVGMKTDGEMVVEHSGEVSRGVTFSGPVSFNSEYTIINAKKLTIDDYIISIGGTGASLGTAGASGGGSGAADSYITTQGGGGLEILRSDGNNANLLWKPTQAGATVGNTAGGGVIGMWWVEGPHVGLTTGAWVYPLDNSFRIETNRIDGDSEGLMFTKGRGATMVAPLVSSGVTGATQNYGDIKLMTQNTAGNSFDHIQFAHYGASNAYTDIINGAVKRRVTAPTNHGFSFGMAVRYDSAVGWTFGIANSEAGAETVGLVTGIQGITIDVAYHGEIVGDFTSATTTGLTLNPGSCYFLDYASGGKLRESAPQDAGNVAKPLLVALDNISALGNAGDRGVIVNYRGSLIPNEADDITAQVSNRILINQVNDFVVGDLVRFEPSEYYGWSGTAGSTGTVDDATTYTNGVWRRGQANSEEEAEVIGIIGDVNVAGDPNKFYMALNGKVSVADNSALVPLDIGQVYFLSANTAPEGRGGMGNSGDSLVTYPPQTTGHVKKPWAVAISTTELILVNYKGEVIGSGAGCAGGGGGGGGSGLTSGITASNVVLFSDNIKDAITGVGGYANTSAISLTTENEIDVHSVLGITTGATSLILKTWSEGSLTLGESSQVGAVKVASGAHISPAHSVGHETCNMGESIWDAALLDTTDPLDGHFNAAWTCIDLAAPSTECAAYSYGFTPGLPIEFVPSTLNSNFDAYDGNTVDTTTLRWGFKISEAVGLGTSANLTKDSSLAEIPTKVWVWAGSSTNNSTDSIRDSWSFIATQAQSIGHLEYTSADGRVYPLSKGIPSSVSETIVPIGTGDVGTVTLPKVSVSSDWAESTSADVRVAVSGYITEATVHSVKEFGGGAGCVVDAGRNLLINGNFDYWQRLQGITTGGKSADWFEWDSTFLGGGHPVINQRIEVPQNHLADRWRMYNHYNWRGTATRGGLSRHEFDFAKVDDVLSRSQSKPAKYYLKLTNNVTTYDGTIPGPAIEQRIEGVDSIHAEKATVSFWARRSAGTKATLGYVRAELRGYASGTGDYASSSSVRAAGEGGVGANWRMYEPLRSPHFDLNDSWTKYSYTFDVPAIVGVSAGNHLANSQLNQAVEDWGCQGATTATANVAAVIPGQGFIGLGIRPIHGSYDEYASGTDSKARSWNGEIDIAQVQFERGASRTEFDLRTPEDELKRCQRYYQKTYEPQTIAGTEVLHDIGGFVRRFDSTISSGLQGNTDFKVEMRCPPTVEVYSKEGTVDKINGIESDDDWNTEYPDGTVINGATYIRVIKGRITKNGYGMLQSGNSNGSATMWSNPDGNSVTDEDWIWHWTADAEI